MRIERKHDTEGRLDQALEELREAEREKAEAENRLKLARKTVLDLMHANRKRTWSIDDGGKFYKATVVSPERVDIDEKGLLESLSVEEREAISETKVVRKKLEEAIERGIVPEKDVVPYLTIKPASPYIRYTEGVLEDADEAQGAGDGS